MTDEEASIRGLSMQLCVFTSTPDMEGLDFCGQGSDGQPGRAGAARSGLGVRWHRVHAQSRRPT